MTLKYMLSHAVTVWDHVDTQGLRHRHPTVMSEFEEYEGCGDDRNRIELQIVFHDVYLYLYG